MIEVKNHPWFVGVQFHPELKSRIVKVHPLFRDFIAAAIDFHENHNLNVNYAKTQPV
jgi:CTP synthase